MYSQYLQITYLQCILIYHRLVSHHILFCMRVFLSHTCRKSGTHHWWLSIKDHIGTAMGGVQLTHTHTHTYVFALGKCGLIMHIKQNMYGGLHPLIKVS